MVYAVYAVIADQTTFCTASFSARNFVIEMSLVPLFDRLLVGRPIVEKGTRTTRGGLLLPETSSRQSLIQAKVLAKGPGKVHPKSGNTMPSSTNIRVGDIVVFPEFAGYRINEELADELATSSGSTKGKETESLDVRIIREDEVLALVKAP